MGGGLEGSRTVALAVARRPEEVVAFVKDARNLPRWASGLCRAVRPDGRGGWVAETNVGDVGLRFVDSTAFGVADHDVTLPDGRVVHVPLRVVATGEGCEVRLTVLRLAGMTDRELEADVAAVRRDLAMLKTLLEQA